MKSSKKILLALLCVLMLVMSVFAFTSCNEEECVHDWQDATCTTPKTCVLCKTTEGEALGHTPGEDDGDCTTAVKCTVCQGTVTAAKEHAFDNACDSTCNNTGCEHTRVTSHNPAADDGDCTTEVKCSVCGTVVTAAKTHTFDNACDKTCNNAGCEHTRVTSHNPAADDGDCTTEVKCSVCNTVVTAAKAHTFDNDCDTTCNNAGCEHTRVTSHNPAADDGDCTTEVKCSVCGTVVTAAKTHTFDNNCDSTCNNAGCEHNRVTTHIPESDDGNCETAVLCSICHNVVTAAKTHTYDDSCDTTCNNTGCEVTRQITHTYEDDGDCTTEVRCSVCDELIVEADEHDFNNSCDSTCNNEGCEFTRAASHTPKADDGDCTTAVLCDVCDGIAIPATEHEYSSAVTTEPTCTESGVRTYTCTHGGCEHSYTETINAKGHAWDYEKQTCDHGQSCSACGATTPALQHEYEEIAHTDATCLLGATVTYKCELCGNEETETTGAPLGHNIIDAELVKTERIGNTCEYVEYYKCNNCGETIESEVHITTHNYKTTVTKEATCVQEGVKTTKCIDCGHNYETPIAVNTATGHNWDDGVVVGNKMVYTCKNCDATKSSIVANDTKAEVSKDDLGDSSLKLENAEIELDNDTLNGIEGSGNLSISATQVGDDTLKDILTPEQSQQIGNNPVYDFSMVQGDKAISKFNGLVTVTLPYKLSPGEDADNIAIWYIDDEGKVTSIKAEYNNGTVTFTTDHFSYYTVTKLTPAERCKLYGHHYVDKVVAPTCISDGYTLHHCLRCGHTYQDKKIDALGHSYSEAVTEATCTVNGKVVYTCETCNHSYQTVIFAIGHKWEISGEKAPTCLEAGYVEHACENCGESYRTPLPQLKHEYVSVKTEQTCEEKGYITNTCSLCGHSYISAYYPAYGHAYNVTWEWSEDFTSAIAILTCARDESHVVTLDGEMSVTVKEPTCTTPGRAHYVATVVYKGIKYVEGKYVEIPMLPHEYQDAWVSGINGHWHECECGAKSELMEHEYYFGECTVCGYVDENYVCTHEWQLVDSKAPLCEEDGFEKYLCPHCEETNEVVIPKLEHSFGGWITDEKTHCKECERCGEQENGGAHEFKDGVCVVCEYACEHEITLVEEKLPTCTEDGFERYECSNCDYAETTVIPKLEHSFGGWITDEKTHCKECEKCGEQENGGAHEFKDGVCVVCEYACEHEITLVEEKLPTCTEDGFERYECSNCDYTETTVIPKLTHSYVEGVCENCGEKDPNYTPDVPSDCTHELTVSETVYFEKYGCCEGTYFTIIRCECGENVRIDPYAPSDMGCEPGDEYVEDEYFDEEKGVTVAHMSFTCVKCGLSMDAYATMRQDGCQMYVEYDYTIVMGDKVIFEHIMGEMTEENHDYVDGVCQNCGNKDPYYKPDVPGDCEHNYTIIKSEQATCEREGYRLYVCENCGEKQEEYLPTLPHSYVDGECEMCGKVEGECSHELTVNETVYFEKYGCCEDTYFTIIRCECGENVRIDPYAPSDMGCEPGDEYVEDEYFDEEKGVTVAHMSFTCVKCGLHMDAYATMRQDGCQMYVEYDYTIVMGDKVIFEHIMGEMTDENHSYVDGVCQNCGAKDPYYKPDVPGDCEHNYTIIKSEQATCEREGMVAYACNNCGLSFVEYIPKLPHSYVDGECEMCGKLEGECSHELTVSETVYFEKYGCCEGTYFTIIRCECGENVRMDPYASSGMECKPGKDAITEQYVDEKTGATVQHIAFECVNCGMYVDAYATVLRKGCELYITNEYTVIVDGEVIFDRLYAEMSQEDHSYVDGVCENCGKEDPYYKPDVPNDCEHSYSVIKTREPDCENVGVIIYACDYCGHSYKETTLPLGHSYVDGECERCGKVEGECNHELTVSETVYFEKYGCCEDTYFTIIRCECGENVRIDPYAPSDMGCEPDDEYVEDVYFDEETGVTVAHMSFTCVKCGLSMDAYATMRQVGCQMYVEYDYTIVMGDKVIFEHIMGEMTEENHDYVDGVCQNCGNKDPYYKPDVPSDCEHSYTIIKSEQATCEREGMVAYACNNCGLSFVEYIPKLPHSYVDGKCEMCGKIEGECSHEIYSDIIELGELGGCEKSYVVLDRCECGMYCYLNMEKSSIWCEPESEDDIKQEIVYSESLNAEVVRMSFNCADCGLFVTVDVLSKNVGCTNELCYYFTFIINEKPIFENALFTQSQVSHIPCGEWKSDASGHWQNCVCGVATLMEEAHTYVGGVCEICGYVDNGEEPCSHEFVNSEVIYLADYGCCDGYFTLLSCECGRYTYIDMDAESKIPCQPDKDSYEYVTSYDEETDTYSVFAKFDCEYCGMHVEMQGTQIEDGCYRIMQCAYTFSKDGVYIIKNARFDEIGFSHNDNGFESVTFDEYSDCGTRFEISKCADCGKIVYAYVMEQRCDVDMSVDGMEKYVYTDGQGTVHTVYTARCKNCSLVYEYDVVAEVMSQCETKYTIICNVYGGEELLLTYERGEWRDSHDYEVEYEFFGNGCEDGYRVSEHCTKCGDGHVWEGKGHQTEYFEYDLSSYCCGGYVSGEICEICDKCISIHDFNVKCSGEETEEEIVEDGYEAYISTFTCDKCGTVFKMEESAKALSECEYLIYGRLEIISNGESVLVLEIYDTDEEHNYERTYEMLGESCEDGIVVMEKCKACGESHQYQAYGHIYEDFNVDLSEYGCGGEISGYGCVGCNEVMHIYNLRPMCKIDEENTSVMEYTDEYGVVHVVRVAVCPDCSLRYEIDEYRENGKENPCSYVINRVISIYSNDALIFSGTLREYREEHNYECEYVLHGESCFDGYTVIEKCENCGYYNEYRTSGHMVTESYAFDLTQYGMCGGYANYSVCDVCKQTVESYVNDYGCNWNYIGITDDGREAYCCESCNTVKYTLRSEGEKNEHCEYVVNETVTYERDGAVVFEFERREYYTSHDYVTDYRLLGESCEDGVEIYGYCKDCGADRGIEYVNWHYDCKNTRYELSEYGACGGYVYVYECACGYAKSAWYDTPCNIVTSESTYVDENGREVFVRIQRCEDCGIEFILREYFLDTDNPCIKDEICEYTISINGSLICTPESIRRGYEQHDYVSSGALMDGAESCEDGVIITNTCRDCGDFYTYETYWHERFEVERYDLSENGCECGGSLRIFKCACGSESYASFYDVGCIFETQYIDPFIDGYTHCSNAYMEVCADCGFAYRYMEYQVQEGCVRNFYQVWQLGYNRESGICHTEVVHKLGYSDYAHNYEYTYSEYPDGEFNVYEEFGVCKDCQSTCKHVYYRDADENTVKYTYEMNNTFDIGANIYDYTVYEYTYYKGFQLTTYEYHKWIPSDGVERESTRYTRYSFDGGCYIETEEIDSNGDHHIWTGGCNTFYWNNVIVKDPTCTQAGLQLCQHTCMYCGNVSDEYEEVIEPIRHYWNYDGELNCYVCTLCGLESENGASGEIVMEDLTDKYGDGESYVVGYHIDREIPYFTYVSLVIGEDGEDIILDVDMWELDGVSAYSFSKTHVEEIAASYGLEIGEYKVAFTFVPEGADGSYDYSIVFD